MIAIPTCPRMPAKAPAPGRYANVPAKTYHSWAAVSNTLLGKMENCPDDGWRWMHTTDDDGTEAQTFGTNVHTAILEPDRFQREVMVLPDINKRSSIERRERAELIAKFPGRIHVEQGELDDIARYKKAVWECEESANILGSVGDREVCYVWVDPETGLLCKGRVDHEMPLSKDVCVMADLKTARSGHPNKFAWACIDYGYHRGGAHYRAGAIIQSNRAVKHYMLIVCEDTDGDKEPKGGALGPGCRVTVYRLGEEALKIGDILRAEGMKKVKECMESGKWPGYGEGMLELKLPVSYMVRFQEEM